MCARRRCIRTSRQRHAPSSTKRAGVPCCQNHHRAPAPAAALATPASRNCLPRCAWFPPNRIAVRYTPQCWSSVNTHRSGRVDQELDCGVGRGQHPGSRRGQIETRRPGPVHNSNPFVVITCSIRPPSPFATIASYKSTVVTMSSYSLRSVNALRTMANISTPMTAAVEIVRNS